MADLSSYWNNSSSRIIPGSNISVPPSPTTPSSNGNYGYAGFLIRFAAISIDGILLIGFLLVFGFIIRLISPDIERFLSDNNNIVITIWILGYFIIFTALFDATPGKRLLHLQVAKSDFAKLSILRVFLREVIGRIVANAIMISYFLVLFNIKKRGLHDFIAGSIVVRQSPPGKHEGLLIIAVFIAIFLLPIFLVGFLATFDPLGRLNGIIR